MYLRANVKNRLKKQIFIFKVNLYFIQKFTGVYLFSFKSSKKI